jgi:hypothetical protein
MTNLKLRLFWSNQILLNLFDVTFWKISNLEIGVVIILQKLDGIIQKKPDGLHHNEQWFLFFLQTLISSPLVVTER